MTQRSLCAWLAMVCSLLLAPAWGYAQDSDSALTDDEQALLPKITNNAASQLLELAASVDALRDQLQQTKEFLTDQTAAVRSLTSGGRSLNDLSGLFDLADVLNTALQIPGLAEQFPQLQQLQQTLQNTRNQFQAMQQQWQKLKQQTSAELASRQAEVQGLVQQYTQLFNSYVGPAQAAINALRNPAAFAKGFLEDELVKRYMQTPYTVGDFAFRFVKHDPTLSIFSPDGGVDVVVDYSGYGQVTGSRLYFVYNKDGLPQPKRGNHFKWQPPDTKAIVGNAFQLLGGAFSSVGVTSVKPDGQSPPNLKVGLDFGGLLPLSPGLHLTATVDVSAKGQVTLVDLAGKYGSLESPAAPISPTVVLYTIGCGLDNATPKNMVFTGRFANPAATPESVYVDTSLTAPMPFDPNGTIKVSAQYVVGNSIKIAQFVGTISPKEITGDLQIPSPECDQAIAGPIKRIVNLHIHCAIDSKGLTAEGVAQLFSFINANVNLALRFNGSGFFQSVTTAKVGGFSALQTINTSFDSGFTNVAFRSSFTTTVDLGIMKADAVVEITSKVADAKKDLPSIGVTASALGATVPVPVLSLDQLTPEKVAEALGKQLGGMLQNTAKAAEKWAADKKELLARWDEHWRDTLSDEAKKYGLDKLPPDVSAGLRDLGKWAAKTWGLADPAVVAFIANPGAELKKLPSNLGRDLANSIRANVSPADLKNILAQVSDIKNPQVVVAAIQKYASPGGKPFQINVGGVSIPVSLPPLPPIPGVPPISVPPISVPPISVPPISVPPIPGVAQPVPGLGQGTQLNKMPPLTLSQLPLALSMLLAADGQNTAADPSAASGEMAAAVLHLKVETALDPLCDQFTGLEITKEIFANNGLQKVGVKLSNCVLASQGFGDGLVGMTFIPVGAADKNAQPVPDTQPGVASITFKNLFDQNTGLAGAAPEFTIEVDSIPLFGTLDISPLVNDAIRAIVVKAIPGIELDGPRLFYENRVAVTNLSDQALDIVATTRSWSDVANKWSREEYSFLIPGSATTFVLRADGSTTRDDLGPALHASEVSIRPKDAGNSWPGAQQAAAATPIVSANDSLLSQRAYMADEMGLITITIGEAPAARSLRLQRSRLEQSFQLSALAARLRERVVYRRAQISAGLDGQGRSTQKISDVTITFSEPQLTIGDDGQAWINIGVTTTGNSGQALNGAIQWQPATPAGSAVSTAAFRCVPSAGSPAVQLIFPRLALNSSDVKSPPLGRYGPLDPQAIAREELLSLVEAMGIANQVAGVRVQDRRQLTIQNSNEYPVRAYVQVVSKEKAPSTSSLATSRASVIPADGGWLEFSVPAGTGVLVRDPRQIGLDGQFIPIEGQTARIRVGDHGPVRDVSLVDENLALGGYRAYEALSVESYVYDVKSNRVPGLKRVVLYRSGNGYYEHLGPLNQIFTMPGDEHGLAGAMADNMILDSTDNWAAQFEHGQTPEDLQIAVRNVASGTANVRVGYQLPVKPWQPKYRLTWGSKWKLSAWAEISNSSPFEWRNVDLRLRTGAPQGGILAGTWQTFEVTNINLPQGARAVVSLGDELPVAARPIMVYQDSVQPAYPRKYLSVACTKAAQDALPGGPLAIYDGDGFRFACDLPDICPKKAPLRVAFPGTELRRIRITKRPTWPVEIGTVTGMVCDTLSFSVARREQHYDVASKHQLHPVRIAFEVPGDAFWPPVVTNKSLGGPDSVQHVCIGQPRSLPALQVTDLRAGDLSDLKLRLFEPKAIDDLIRHVIGQRDLIATLTSQKTALERELAILESCTCTNNLTQQRRLSLPGGACEHARQATQIALELRKAESDICAQQRTLSDFIAQIATAIRDSQNDQREAHSATAVMR
jgi:hypothetical protein